MSKIKILPEILSNKIAAGEVVERPASVIKELIENALDAGGNRISIEVEKGGRSLLRVADNGVGMSRDDALLALERYATSKIYKDEDLFAISTLGFRGEALPSIASVSRLCLVTKDEASAVGTKIVIEGGTIKEVVDVGAPVGTMITVEHLFFNTPARRKFLKTVDTEMGHIADTIAGFALGRPEVQFRLVHNRKEIKNWPPATDHLDRVVDVIGREVENALYRIEFDNDAVSVDGWSSSPMFSRSTSRGMYIYVNGRFVRDRVIRHALLEGYSGRLMKGKFPVSVLFIKVPFDQVDVNVHPTKSEIRFAQQKRIHDAVSGAVAKALRFGDRPWISTKRTAESPTEAKHQIAEQVSAYSRAETGALRLKSASREASETLRWDEKRDGTAEQALLWKERRFGDLRVIGQVHNTYILCESTAGLILIDQHAAHERILFEQFKSRSAASKTASQKLVLPETIEFGYREAQILTELIPNLNALGLEIEPFGGNAFVVKAAPVKLAERELKPLVIEIVEKMAEIGFTPGLEKALDECLILMACHGAIRANQALSDRQIKHLLDQLDQCDNPAHCPHGRPIWIRWSLQTLEKSFKRIV